MTAFEGWEELETIGEVETMRDLLQQAATAHHAYEQQLGHRDEKWAEWYAQYMIGLMHKRRIKLQL